MCSVLGVSRSGYYHWRGRCPSRRSLQNRLLAERIRTLHRQTREVYGAVKMWHQLQALGIRCGKHRVARLRRCYGIESRRQRRFRRKYAIRHQVPPVPNLLGAPFSAEAADEVWVGDMTYIRTRQGWLYLAVLLDLYSRHVVGWAMSARPDRHLALDALSMAVEQRRPQPGLIHHTDQGSPYASGHYRKTLDEYGLVASMSRKGNCYDNAVAESFFSTLKNELVHDCDFLTRNEARTAIFEYIEGFYNRKRLHQSLGYLSPDDYVTMQAVA
jgi:transposase InsO family protein